MIMSAIESLIHFAAMAYIHGVDHESSVLQLAKDAIASHSIPPQPGQIARQSLTVHSRVLAAFQVRVDPFQYQRPIERIELSQLFQRML